MKNITYLIAAFALTYALTSCSLTTKDGTVFTLTPEAIHALEIIADK
jgi:hypothetical protein